MKKTKKPKAQRKLAAAGAIKSKNALAAALSIHRHTLAAVLARPDCPPAHKDGSFDLIALRAFIERQGIGRRHKSKDKAAVELSILHEKERRLKLENDYREGRLVERSKDVEVATRAVVLFRQVLEHKFLNELPPIYTTDAPGNQEANERALNEALNEFCFSLVPICVNERAPDGRQLEIFEDTISRMRNLYKKNLAATPNKAIWPARRGRAMRT